jgi:HNH endonuclease
MRARVAPDEALQTAALRELQGSQLGSPSTAEEEGAMSGKDRRFLRTVTAGSKRAPRLRVGASAEERFWAKVDRRGPDDCWLWTAGRFSNGYGQFALCTVQPLKPVVAHRAAWQLTHGSDPYPLHVCHRCDVKLCCNPAHLFLGTHADNMADMVAKGRNCGPRRRLSAQRREEIKAALLAGDRQIEVASRFGVDLRTVNALNHTLKVAV